MTAVQEPRWIRSHLHGRRAAVVVRDQHSSSQWSNLSERSKNIHQRIVFETRARTRRSTRMMRLTPRDVLDPRKFSDRDKKQNKTIVLSTSVLPATAARFSGVLPRLFCAWTSAPLASSSFTMPTSPWQALRWRAVSRKSSFSSTILLILSLPTCSAVACPSMPEAGSECTR